MIIPEKLKRGDKIRVIAPSLSFGLISQRVRQVAKQTMESLGLQVTFSENIDEHDTLTNSSSVTSRITDIHAAFADPTVKGIFTVIGGYSCNQLISHLEYDLIKRNPKVLCGYSDITVLSTAILAKTGLVTYSGPHYSTFGMGEGNEFTIEYFTKCLFESSPIEINPAKTFSDDQWWLDDTKRHYIPTPGMQVITAGEAEGTIVGGNIWCFSLLRGTPYMPQLPDRAILFLEDEETSGEYEMAIFDHLLESLILAMPDFAEKVVGIVVGRYPIKANFTPEKVRKVLHEKLVTRDIPCLCNVDFGHTFPMITFPIGGRLKMQANIDNPRLMITEH